MLTRRSSKLMLVPARGECSPTKPQRKRFSRFPVQGSTVVLCQCSYTKQRKQNVLSVLWGWWDMAQHTLLEQTMFQQAFSDLFPSASPFTLLSLKEKREADSGQMLSISLPFLSLLSHCWDNYKRWYHWLATSYHCVRDLYTEVEIQVELNNIFTFGSLSLEA